MEKLIYLVWKRDDATIEAFRDQLVGDVGRRLLAEGACGADGQRLGPACAAGQGSGQYMGEGKSISACVSLWLDSLDARPPIEAALGAIAVAPRRLPGDRVDAAALSRPRLGRRHAQSGRDAVDGVPEARPGQRRGVLRSLARPPHAAVVRDPPAVGVHAQRRGARSRRARRPTAPSSRSASARLEDLTDPNRFFGKPENIQRVLADIATFIDLESVNNAPMSEWILKAGC